MQMRITGHLIIPFGRPKWSIKDIRIIGVSTNATYFESDTPCVHIDKGKEQPLRLRDFESIFPSPEGGWTRFSSTDETLAFIRYYLNDTCEVQTGSERMFLDLYLEYCRSMVAPSPYMLQSGDDKLPRPYNSTDWVFHAMMPLPQAHLYLTNPLSDDYSFAPKNMVKVDFAFWTGKEIVAVEIDGPSHIGNPQHINKDRMLQRAGVSVVHILNDELTEYGRRAVSNLLPYSLTGFSRRIPEADYAVNPLSIYDLPF